MIGGMKTAKPSRWLFLIIALLALPAEAAVMIGIFMQRLDVMLFGCFWILSIVVIVGCIKLIKRLDPDAP